MRAANDFGRVHRLTFVERAPLRRQGQGGLLRATTRAVTDDFTGWVFALVQHLEVNGIRYAVSILHMF